MQPGRSVVLWVWAERNARQSRGVALSRRAWRLHPGEAHDLVFSVGTCMRSEVARYCAAIRPGRSEAVQVVEGAGRGIA